MPFLGPTLRPPGSAGGLLGDAFVYRDRAVTTRLCPDNFPTAKRPLMLNARLSPGKESPHEPDLSRA